MEPKKEIVRHGKKYTFVKQINKDLFLYETKYYKECFSRFDLRILPELDFDVRERKAVGKWAGFEGY